MKTIVPMVCLLISLSLLLGCGSDPKSGEIGLVVDKAHHEAYTTWIHNGKSLIMVSHPERWEIVVEFGGKKAYTKTYDLPESIWNDIRAGDKWAIR